MEPWAWIAAYLIGFALLQLLLYRYFRRDVPQGETTTPHNPESGRRAAHSRASPPADGEVTCPHCGSVNEREQSFTFCRECVSPLD